MKLLGRSSIAALFLAARLSHAQTIESPLSAKTSNPPPGVDVWFDQENYQTFDKAMAYFSAEPGAYVVIVRVTPRGTLDILYPRSPNEQAPYRATTEARTRLIFRNDGAEGFGEISAISSAAPFDFSKVSDGTKWNARRLSHPRPGFAGSLSNAFFDDISGAPGSRYGIASATYGVGTHAGEYAAGSYGVPTAVAANRAIAERCKAYAMNNPPSADPSCVAVYMQSSDPKPKLGGPKPRSSGGSETEAPPIPKK